MTINKDIIQSTNFYTLQANAKASNLVKSAVYRWFQLYERPLTQKRMELQMELLAENVRIISDWGCLSSKDQFPDQFLFLNQEETAFHLDDINVYPCGVGIYTAQTTLIYQEKKEDGEILNVQLKFDADLIKKEDFSFQFIRIRVKEIDKKEKAFSEGLVQQRSNALIHQLLGIVEYNLSDSEYLKPCFSNQFVMHPLNEDKITDLKELQDWIEKMNATLHDIAITPVNIVTKRISDIEYLLQFDALFEGKNEAKEAKISLSKNIWVVTDSIEDPYPRIKMIAVEKLEPIFI